jgi:uncharacterized protein
VALILRGCERRAVPWKNGGGVTREVAVYPAGSDFECFDWRMSIAEVHAAGPFSIFPGVDRHMAVLAGRLELSIAGRSLDLTVHSAPVQFAGDLPVHAVPQGGPATDLNLMTRRARCSARLSRECCSQRQQLAGEAGTIVVLALAPLRAQVAGSLQQLAALDALLLPQGAECELHPPHGGASMHYYRAEIRGAATV